MPDSPPRVLYYEQEKHVRRYCIARMSDAMCDAITFLPPLILFLLINKCLKEKRHYDGEI